MIELSAEGKRQIQGILDVPDTAIYNQHVWCWTWIGGVPQTTLGPTYGKPQYHRAPIDYNQPSGFPYGDGQIWMFLNLINNCTITPGGRVYWWLPGLENINSSASFVGETACGYTSNSASTAPTERTWRLGYMALWHETLNKVVVYKAKEDLDETTQAYANRGMVNAYEDITDQVVADPEPAPALTTQQQSSLQSALSVTSAAQLDALPMAGWVSRHNTRLDNIIGRPHQYVEAGNQHTVSWMLDKAFNNCAQGTRAVYILPQNIDTRPGYVGETICGHTSITDTQSATANEQGARITYFIIWNVAEGEAQAYKVKADFPIGSHRYRHQTTLAAYERFFGDRINKIRIGASTPTKIFKGSTEVDRRYYGTEEIYRK